MLIGGAFFWQYKEKTDREIDNLKQNNEKLAAEYRVLEEEKKEVLLALEQIEKRRQDMYLIYTMLKQGYFRPPLSNASIISVAILLNDKEICNDVKRDDKQFCIDIFEENCNKYEHPNKQMCAGLFAILDRKITAPDIISHCNSKSLIEDDSTQAHCFQGFARMTNNISLCDEICKAPINNTNCIANCRDDENKLVPCKTKYIQDCRINVLENNP